ncbi:MAG: UDP-N-acetylmuramate:L-alanyl-gamma-D-glutamyl-meso-diaminopimelate ligase [Verrucomicrobia bacterium]|nr:UDP-N-acetylmuramate:L-alanyl-gamma-D-glutamyl-meso-diaminopimelate ligase [Verrucomicrobiota bacterium]
MFGSVQKVHFLGVCGTAMGAVAAALRDRGYAVTGSDQNVYPPMSTFLASKGVLASEGYRAENVPDEVDLVIIGNAITRGNPELEAVLNRRLLYRSLPETLKDFFLRNRRNVVVTGTHGKTTTTALVAWIFRQAGLEPSFLVGGIAKDLGQGAFFSESDYFILEGDEYDTAFFDKRSKFLHYLPECVVINNIEFDHADIFRDLAEIKLSFQRLVGIVPGNGRIFINADDPNCVEVTVHALARVESVGFGPGATHRVEAARFESGATRFRLGQADFEMQLLGEFNVRNAAMAVVAARSYGLSDTDIRRGLASFSGVARRQEIRGEVNGIKVIDDFGHHPTAIRETLAGLRQRFPRGRIWAVFEPRSNTTRRAVFQTTLPGALRLADGVILAQVARIEQLPLEDRLDPLKVVDAIAANGIPAFYEPKVDNIVARLKPLARPGDVIVVFSNGGFQGIHQRLLTELAA